MCGKACDPEVCFCCGDCSVDTFEIGEYYSVRNSLWRKFGNQYGMLCVSCLETRLGRKLRRRDFTNYPINRGVFPQSERLLERLEGRS